MIIYIYLSVCVSVSLCQSMYVSVLSSTAAVSYCKPSKIIIISLYRSIVGFLGKLQGDSPGLLVCYSVHVKFSGAALKISAYFKLFQTYN